MITIFHVFTFIVCLIGFVGGSVVGHKFLGGWGSFGGALAGAYVGLVIGRLLRLVLAALLRPGHPTAPRNQLKKSG